MLQRCWFDLKGLSRLWDYSEIFLIALMRSKNALNSQHKKQATTTTALACTKAWRATYRGWPPVLGMFDKKSSTRDNQYITDGTGTLGITRLEFACKQRFGQQRSDWITPTGAPTSFKILSLKKLVGVQSRLR